MGMVQRVTYRRHNHYNTASNKVKKVKTPGGRLVLQHVKKIAKAPKCRDTGVRLKGIARRRGAFMLRDVKKTKRSVARAYGGVLCPKAVRAKIMRAFLVEEQRCVKMVLAEKESAQKASEKPDKKKAAKKKGGKK